jgi:hypothetical protein
MPLNSIIDVELLERMLDPVQAELWVRVKVATHTEATEVRGRLAGPRCPGIDTVEVAYPLRSLAGPQEASGNTIIRRVVIPEPNFWTAETPFLYEAVVELWEDGQRIDERRFSYKLRRASRSNPQET